MNMQRRWAALTLGWVLGIAATSMAGCESDSEERTGNDMRSPATGERDERLGNDPKEQNTGEGSNPQEEIN